MIAIIFSVVLSLKSASDYDFTTPALSNGIVGVGLQASGSNTVIRSEDVAFLYEAFAERHNLSDSRNVTQYGHADTTGLSSTDLSLVLNAFSAATNTTLMQYGGGEFTWGYHVNDDKDTAVGNIITPEGTPSPYGLFRYAFKSGLVARPHYRSVSVMPGDPLDINVITSLYANAAMMTNTIFTTQCSFYPLGGIEQTVVRSNTGVSVDDYFPDGGWVTHDGSGSTTNSAYILEGMDFDLREEYGKSASCAWVKADGDWSLGDKRMDESTYTFSRYTNDERLQVIATLNQFGKNGHNRVDGVDVYIKCTATYSYNDGAASQYHERTFLHKVDEFTTLFDGIHGHVAIIITKMPNLQEIARNICDQMGWTYPTKETVREMFAIDPVFPTNSVYPAPYIEHDYSPYVAVNRNSRSVHAEIGISFSNVMIVNAKLSFHANVEGGK